METLKNITDLRVDVKLADTTTEEGRSFVATSCRNLYDLIEDGLYNKYGEDAIVDAYNDLCRGDFAEPYHCEVKKSKFELYAKIYVEQIAE